MVSSDFLARAGLNSLDLKVERVITWGVGAGVGAAAPRKIPSYAAGVIFVASGLLSVSIEGNAIAAAVTDGALTVPAGATPILGLELAADTTPFAFNGTAGALQISAVVLTRKRTLEKLPGQV